MKSKYLYPSICKGSGYWEVSLHIAIVSDQQNISPFFSFVAAGYEKQTVICTWYTYRAFQFRNIPGIAFHPEGPTNIFSFNNTEIVILLRGLRTQMRQLQGNLTRSQGWHHMWIVHRIRAMGWPNAVIIVRALVKGHRPSWKGLYYESIRTMEDTLPRGPTSTKGWMSCELRIIVMPTNTRSVNKCIFRICHIR